MKRLKTIEIDSITSLETAKYVPTQLVTVKVEGQSIMKYWEMIVGYDSVHALVINRETEEIILVEQVRIPVLVNTINDTKNNSGIVTECIAGLVDKNSSNIQIVKEEILEECGYDVPLDNIEPLKVLKSSVGTSGTNAYTFIAEVNETMKVNEGGGLPEEDIRVKRIPFEDIFEWLVSSKDHTDAITSFLITYFMFMDASENM